MSNAQKLRLLMAKIDALRPDHGGLPDTDEQWAKLLPLIREFDVLVYQENGASRKEAERIATVLYGPKGSAKRLMMELAFNASAGAV